MFLQEYFVFCVLHVILFIIFNCQIGVESETTTHKCQIIGLTDGYDWESTYQLSVKDDTIRGLIATYKTEDISSITDVCGSITDTCGKYLTATFDDEELKISTNKAFETFEEYETSGFITIRMTFVCPDSSPKVTFIQEIEDVNTHIEFSKSTYEYKLPMPWPKTLDITMLGPIVVTDIDFKNRKIDFNIDDNNYIEIIPSAIDEKFKTYPAILRPKIPLKLQNDLSLNIYATDQSDVYGTQHVKEIALVKIIIDKEESVPPDPKFEKLQYQGRYYDSNKLELEDIKIEKETYSESIEIIITGKYSKNFDLKHVKDNKYKLEITEVIDPDVWNAENFISLALEIKDGNTGSIIILKYVNENPSTTTECPPTTECPSIPDDCKMELKFLEPLEMFVTIPTNFKGEISNKKAIQFPESTVKYSGDIPDFVQIDENTGVVTIENSEFIQQNVYEFDVNAENGPDKSSYKINLYVQHKPVTSENALTILTIPENKAQKDLIKLDSIDKKQNCKFEIKSIAPDDADLDWFVLNSKTQNIDVNSIDRSHKAFKKMYLEEVQAQLTLEINCKITDIDKRFMNLFKKTSDVNKYVKILNLLNDKNNSMDKNEQKGDNDHFQWIYTDEISQNSEQMIVTIRIDNTDNHAPVFTETPPLIIGYPNIELIEFIHPPFVCQVHATDEDIGLNGKFVYKLEATDSLFIIHATTGVIYPTKNFFSFIDRSSTIQLTAMAVDQNGEGLSAKLPITISVLTLELISVLKIEKGLIENLPEILMELSKATKWSVKQVTSAVIPETDNETFFSSFINKINSTITKTIRKLTGDTDNDNLSLLSIYTYAINMDNEIVSADEFTEKIKDIQIENVDWTVESVKPHSDTITEIIVERKTDKGLLIAVIILSITFVSYIIGSICYCKRRSKNNNDITLSTKLPSTKHAEDASIEPDFYLNGITRPSVLLNDNLIGTTNDDDTSANNTFKPSNNISLRERKKSAVTFNDEVEHIELNEHEIQHL